ncbi:MAG: class I SAM-dependent methyltransferase, partial [Pseudomonadota bacterium]
MNREEFDKFAAEYEKMLRDNVSASGEGPEFFAEYKVADMRRRWDVRSLGREPETIVDFGGGVGASAPHMRKYFPQARIIIADVSSKSLEVAEARGIDRVDC